MRSVNGVFSCSTPSFETYSATHTNHGHPALNHPLPSRPFSQILHMMSSERVAELEQVSARLRLESSSKDASSNRSPSIDNDTNRLFKHRKLELKTSVKAP